MWGIVPAAGRGGRIQPLAVFKELAPVGCRITNGVERPLAVGEYPVERMIAAGVVNADPAAGGTAGVMVGFGRPSGRASTPHGPTTRSKA